MAIGFSSTALQASMYLPEQHSFVRSVQIQSRLDQRDTGYIKAFHAIALEPWAPTYRQKLEINFLLGLATRLCEDNLGQFVRNIYAEVTNINLHGMFIHNFDNGVVAPHTLPKPENDAKRDQQYLHDFADMIVWKGYLTSMHNYKSGMQQFQHGTDVVILFINICTMIVVSLNADGLTTEAQWQAEAHRENVYLKVEELISALHLMIGDYAKLISI